MGTIGSLQRRVMPAMISREDPRDPFHITLRCRLRWVERACAVQSFEILADRLNERRLFAIVRFDPAMKDPGPAADLLITKLKKIWADKARVEIGKIDGDNLPASVILVEQK